MALLFTVDQEGVRASMVVWQCELARRKANKVYTNALSLQQQTERGIARDIWYLFLTS